MIDFASYENLMEFPCETDHMILVYSVGDEKIFSMKVKDLDNKDVLADKKKAFKDAKRVTTVTEILDKESYTKALNCYYEHEADLNEKFRRDVMSDLGITNNPKAGKLMSIAWDRGRDSGFRGIFEAASEMVDLIIDY